MPASFTYATLKPAITDWLEDPSDEFQANLDRIIALGESRLVKDLDLEIFSATDTGSFTPGNQQITKPANVVALRTLTYVIGGRVNYLYQRTYEYLQLYWPNAASRGDPKFFCELSEAAWMVAPTPVRTLTWTARFIKRPTGLSTGTPTTFLSTNAADSLFYACLLEAEAFIKADKDDIVAWAELYKTALDSSRNELRRIRSVDFDAEVEA